MLSSLFHKWQKNQAEELIGHAFLNDVFDPFDKKHRQHGHENQRQDKCNDALRKGELRLREV